MKDETSPSADGSSLRPSSQRWALWIATGYAVVLIALFTAVLHAADEVTFFMLTGVLLVMMAPASLLLLIGAVTNWVPNGALGLPLLGALCAGMNVLILYAIVRRWTRAAREPKRASIGDEIHKLGRSPGDATPQNRARERE